MPGDGNEQENLCDVQTRMSSKVQASVRISAHTHQLTSTGRPQREWQDAFSATSSLWIQRAKLMLTQTLLRVCNCVLSIQFIVCVRGCVCGCVCAISCQLFARRSAWCESWHVSFQVSSVNTAVKLKKNTQLNHNKLILRNTIMSSQSQTQVLIIGQCGH